MGPIDLSLTHGQVAWALARGQRPSDQLIDQLRYRRATGADGFKRAPRSLSRQIPCVGLDCLDGTPLFDLKPDRRAAGKIRGSRAAAISSAPLP
jgi:hypothetical protein